jgi:ribosome-associated protein
MDLDESSIDSAFDAEESDTSSVESSDSGEAVEAPKLTRSERPSRSARKRDSHDLQMLGQQLLDLPASWLKDLEMPERLRDALDGYRTTRTFEGKRRQVQFIGKVIRSVDHEPLREAVASFQLGHARNALSLHEAEGWRTRLLHDEKTAMNEWLLAYPNTDTQALRALLRQIRKDMAAADEKPGQTERHGRAYRELFQFIKQTLKGAGADAVPDEGMYDGD